MTRTGFGKSKLAAALLAFPLVLTPLAAGAEQGPVTAPLQSETAQVDQAADSQISENRLLSRLILVENRAKIAEVLAKLANQPQMRIEQALRDKGTRATLERFDVSLAKFAVAIEPHWTTVVRQAEAEGQLTGLQAQLLLQRIAEGYGTDADEARPQIGPVRDLARMEGRTLTNQALAELSGKSLGQVQSLIGEIGNREAAAALAIAPDALQQAVVAKIKARIEAAASDGRIATGQAAKLLDGLSANSGQNSG
ncbi:MAG: hypothetical protein RIC87_02105 [Kiloniellales bacterium]